MVIQAMSGLMSVTGIADGEPVKCGVPVGDFSRASMPRTRSRPSSRMCVHRASRHGLIVRCWTVLLLHRPYKPVNTGGAERCHRALGSAHPRNAPYQAFMGCDRPFVVAAGNDRLWQRVCEITNLEHLIDDPRFASQPSRAANQAQLAANCYKSGSVPNRRHTG